MKHMQLDAQYHHLKYTIIRHLSQKVRHYKLILLVSGHQNVLAILERPITVKLLQEIVLAYQTTPTLYPFVTIDIRVPALLLGQAKI